MTTKNTETTDGKPVTVDPMGHSSSPGSPLVVKAPPAKKAETPPATPTRGTDSAT
jgi:hypothetical protein